jgi:hypothetical protein
MNKTFDIEAAHAAFTLPNDDGSFDLDFRHYLRELGESRRSIILAFAPKAAGTYLRTACIVAAQGTLVRTVHAQGGRDAAFYLPTFLSYYVNDRPSQLLVTHVHMQALPANRYVIEALDLKPIIMIRSIPDMLASYMEMLEPNPLSADNWLNISVPEDYKASNEAHKADFVVDMMGPWYASYFSTWLNYATSTPGRVCILTYEGFLTNPLATLEKMLEHSRVPRPREVCRAALDEVWEERSQFRFNKGISGRGRSRFTAAQIMRLERQIGFYPNLYPIREVLVPPLGSFTETSGRYGMPLA